MPRAERLPQEVNRKTSAECIMWSPALERSGEVLLPQCGCRADGTRRRGWGWGPRFSEPRCEALSEQACERSDTAQFLRIGIPKPGKSRPQAQAPLPCAAAFFASIPA